MAMQDDLIGRAAHRAEITARAEAQMAGRGVDRAFIDRLVETFYGRIQAHPTLGPVFDTRLSGRWPEHLAKMKAFWSSVAFKNGAYGGKPVQAHHGVAGITEGLFAEWLGAVQPDPRRHGCDGRSPCLVHGDGRTDRPQPRHRSLL